jgi:hypothetical protein
MVFTNDSALPLPRSGRTGVVSGSRPGSRAKPRARRSGQAVVRRFDELCSRRDAEAPFDGGIDLPFLTVRYADEVNVADATKWKDMGGQAQSPISFGMLKIQCVIGYRRTPRSIGSQRGYFGHKRGHYSAHVDPARELCHPTYTITTFRTARALQQISLYPACLWDRLISGACRSRLVS